MTFEQTLRDRISKAPFKSKEKDLLKVVLGAYQQKAASGKVTDEQGIAIVKSMVGTNNEMLFGNPEKNPPTKPLFKNDDPRRAVIVQENEILATLLPSYLSAQEIESSLREETGMLSAIRDAKSDGQAMGLAVGWFKAANEKVENETLKAVVKMLRSSAAESAQ